MLHPVLEWPHDNGPMYLTDMLHPFLLNNCSAFLLGLSLVQVLIYGNSQFLIQNNLIKEEKMGRRCVVTFSTCEQVLSQECVSD